ncbi:MAG: chloride channel protein, partial [Prevotella bivia]|nr:chloride channel protein [Prevotella bivia]
MDITEDNSTVAQIGIIDRFDKWRSEFISDRQFVYILAFLVGVLASVAAYVLHTMICEIEELLTSGFKMTNVNWLYLLYPVIGIWLTTLFIKYVVRDSISHGIT